MIIFVILTGIVVLILIKVLSNSRNSHSDDESFVNFGVSKGGEDNRLFDCANRNNKGIAYEKSGEIDKAISIYEENIAGDCYPATHSFDRLMILYRKRKDYDNEIRVIEKAIIVFSEVNRQRAEKAIKENPRKRKEIENALITNENVPGNKLQASNGKYLYCFCPYNVNKYKDRLIKAKELKTRNNI